MKKQKQKNVAVAVEKIRDPAFGPNVATMVHFTPPRDATLGVGERKILVACAQHQDGVTREQLTVLTGYRRSTRDTYLQRLGAAGLVTPRGQLFAATPAGIAALGDFETLPTGDDLRRHWLRNLTGGEREILWVICNAWPEPVSREALTEATAYARSSRDTYLQRLMARRLVDAVNRGEVRASDQLFDAGSRP